MAVHCSGPVHYGLHCSMSSRLLGCLLEMFPEVANYVAVSHTADCAIVHILHICATFWQNPYTIGGLVCGFKKTLGFASLGW